MKRWEFMTTSYHVVCSRTVLLDLPSLGSGQGHYLYLSFSIQRFSDPLAAPLIIETLVPFWEYFLCFTISSDHFLCSSEVIYLHWGRALALFMLLSIQLLWSQSCFINYRDNGPVFTIFPLYFHQLWSFPAPDNNNNKNFHFRPFPPAWFIDCTDW